MKKTRCPACGGVIQIDETQEILQCESCHKQYKNPLYKPPVAQPEVVEQPEEIEQPKDENTVEQPQADSIENEQNSAPVSPSEEENSYDDSDEEETVDDEEESETDDDEDSDDDSDFEDEDESVEDDTDSETDDEVVNEYAEDYVPSNNGAPIPVYAPVDAKKEGDSAARTSTKGLTKSMLGISISTFVFALILTAFETMSAVQRILLDYGIYQILYSIPVFFAFIFAIVCLALSASANSANKATSDGYTDKAKALMGAQIAFSLFLVLIFIDCIASSAMSIIVQIRYSGIGLKVLLYSWQLLLFLVIYIVCFGLSLALLVKSCKTLVICKKPVTFDNTDDVANANIAPAQYNAPVPVTNPAAPVTVQAVPVTTNVAPSSVAPTSRESKFTGGLWSLIGLNLSNALLIIFTLGLGTPCAICREYRWLCRHQVIDGRRLVFEGTAASLFGHWIKWMLLGFITLGIYFFWLPIKQQKWITEHTHFEQN